MCLAQTTIFRGALEISPHLGIPVWAYCQVRAQTLPSLKKLSIPALEADGDSCAVRQRPLLLVRGMPPNAVAHTQVKMSRQYFSQDNVNEPVEAEERAKGHKYGKQLVRRCVLFIASASHR